MTKRRWTAGLWGLLWLVGLWTGSANATEAAFEVAGYHFPAIEAGGTTLRDFYGGDGEPGYFRQQLEVYDREGEHCRTCNTIIRAIVQGQRSTYYCKNCQT